MNLEAVLKLVALVKGALDALPALVASVKGTLSETDEKKLQEALAGLRSVNDAKYDETQAALAARAAQAE